MNASSTVNSHCRGGGEGGGGGWLEEEGSGTEKRCSHSLQSGHRGGQRIIAFSFSHGKDIQKQEANGSGNQT